jgi:hypothetical protein
LRDYNATKKNATKKKMSQSKQPKQRKKAKGGRIHVQKQPSAKSNNTPTTPAASKVNNTAADSKKTSPSADTVPKTHINALKMEEDGVFEEGYDSDVYIGPERGTDQAELDALKEESLPESSPPEAESDDANESEE